MPGSAALAGSLSLDAASLFPGFAVVVFLKVADDDAPGGGGVNEFAVLEVKPDVVDAPAAFVGGVEENEVSRLQAAPADAAAVLFGDVLGGSGELFAIYLIIEVAHQPGTVHALAGGAAIAVGDAQPGGGFGVEVEVVPFGEGDAELAGELRALRLAGACQLPAVATGGEQQGGEEGEKKGKLCFHLFFWNM